MSIFVGKLGVAALTGCLWLGASGALARDVPTDCARSGDPNAAVAGALIGGATGALIGNAASGRKKTQGTVLGGLGGAIAGAVIGGNLGQARPCPQGYVYRAAPPPEDAAAYDGPPPRYDDPGDVRRGPPLHIHDRIMLLRRRVASLDRDGGLSSREHDHLVRQLDEIEDREEDVLRRNDGRLPPEVREHFEADLDDVARHLRREE
jgi:hypothetical protein